MKKSKENEHRISNLKDMLNNVKDEDINESADNSEDVFDVKDNEEYEEDEELDLSTALKNTLDTFIGR